MKKILSFMLAVCLVLTLCFQLTIESNAATTEVFKLLPKVGDIVEGFKTIELKDLNLVNSKTALFVHEKTGAKLLYVQNKDIDRSFDITFKTPAKDNTGVNHILEHITISGSQKYPLKDVLFTVLNQTYSTYANAATFLNATTYPVSSMSEDQLLKLTDVYLDCVYNPSVYTDKNVFLREACRLEMADTKAPLEIKGIVYNEMKGALGNIASVANSNVMKTLFPNSVQGNISGGNPDDIKNLTYEQLIKTHDTYYHPSNSLMVLYGNVDYSKFLKLINDEYLSKYEKKDIIIDEGKVKPFTKKVEKNFKFPVSATANTKNTSQIDYAYAITDISEEDSLGLSIIATLLNQDTSPLKKAFSGKQIGGNVTVSYNDKITQPVLTFTVQNADEGKAKEFKNIVDKCVDDIVKSGLDKTSIDAIISTSLLSNSNFTELGNVGVNLSYVLAQTWAKSGNTNYLYNVINDLKNIQTKTANNYLENLTEKYIVKNNHAALVTTIPDAGLAEKQVASEQKFLSDLKASMSEKEISNRVSITKSYNEWNSKEINQEIIDSLQVVNISDLPEEVKSYKINETVDSYGTRIITAEANVGDIQLTTLLLDTSSVPVEKLHYLQLYASLLGNIDTKTYLNEELDTKTIRYLGGAGFNLTTIKKGDNQQFNPYLTISWAGLIGEYNQQVNLVKDILLNTKFDNSDVIQNQVKKLIANWKASFTNEPLNIQVSRASAQFNDEATYMNYISGIEYYNFLIELERALTSNPMSVVTELQEINKLVINKTNMITAFAGNKNNTKKYEDTIKLLLDALPAQNLPKQQYTKVPKPALREGIAVDSTVQYNVISATYDKIGTKFNGKFIPLQLLINENYTTPNIRLRNGAYGTIEDFSLEGFLLASYRDPNIKETFEIFKGLPEFLRNINITQESLDKYILKAFSNYSVPKGELVGAENAITDYLLGRSENQQLKTLHEIKSLTVQDVKDFAIIIENFLKHGAYSTVGNLQKLTENKELYDAIVAIDQGTEETLTRAQFFDVLLAGATDTLTVAKENGLIVGDGKGNYLEDNKITKQEIAVIISKVAGMNGVQLNGEEIKISDIDSVSSYAKNSVKMAVNTGIIKLDDNGNFNPGAELTVAEVQAILTGLVNKLSGK